MAAKTLNKEINKTTIKATVLRKVPTGIPGLDYVLHGGLPSDNIYVIPPNNAISTMVL